MRITSRYPAVHGAPVHAGTGARDHGPGLTGLRRRRADRPREIPAFWACGLRRRPAVMGTGSAVRDHPRTGAHARHRCPGRRLPGALTTPVARLVHPAALGAQTGAWSTPAGLVPPPVSPQLVEDLVRASPRESLQLDGAAPVAGLQRGEHLGVVHGVARVEPPVLEHRRGRPGASWPGRGRCPRAAPASRRPPPGSG
ncbi:DUF1445 domain-containing protein [Kocuria rhizophila]|nr:DUF1445 domain-containing protein [Kocuria rhizophila]